ncbi:MAG: P-II family nitrogen regulator [Candidatus Omnitrophica bacterium]|nr:P-II family nitrogen regulator [Candidatus Omnitrophota bacterium]
MKKVEAIIRPSTLQKVLDALAVAGYPGVTVSEVTGHGKQKGITQEYRGQSHEGLLHKLKVEVVVEDSDAKKLINAITKAAKTGEIGDGKIFISPVEEAIRIRTGESGAAAI